MNVTRNICVHDTRGHSLIALCEQKYYESVMGTSLLKSYAQFW